ncbi:MAG: RHS repeat-associated core domain-containing protein [Candidatus Binatia bacterium]
MHASLMAPATSTQTRLPSGLTATLAESRRVTLVDPADPTRPAAVTIVRTINGNAFTQTYDAATRTRTDVSAMGRIRTTMFDAAGRVVATQQGPLAPVMYGYDALGLLATLTRGTGPDARVTTLTYDAARRLRTLTDPLGRTTALTPDAADRVVAFTRPDGAVVGVGYDGNGNVTAVTPPGQPAHTFAYTPVDLEARYSPPALGAGDWSTQYAYNHDRQLARSTRPDGQTIVGTYDGAGRPAMLQTPEGPTTFAYEPATGLLQSMTTPAGVGLTYGYDGRLVTSATWSGAVTGRVAWTYDPDFHRATETVGDTLVGFGYDPDGLLIQAGDLLLTRDAATGLVTATTLGAVGTTDTTNAFGELTGRTTTGNGLSLLTLRYTRDAAGRIVTRTETLGGETKTDAYGYDAAGRLTTVTRDGTLAVSYAYDANGNRVARTVGGAAVSATVDAQDRLLADGATAYTYTANGERATKIDATGTTAYTYDVFGNLRRVELPDGKVVDYLVDGEHRRVGRVVNGVVTQRWVYQDPLRPVAEVDATGNVITRYVYGTQANVPAYCARSGATYRILTDPLGSPRLVVDVTTGTVVQRIDYDEFGRVTTDTNPGFQPFGFAGGLYDPDTGLVRFGARDYDAAVGQWTAKDPIRFRGGDTNLHGYVLNDPINGGDPTGLAWGDWHCVTATVEGTTANGLNATTAYGFNTDTDVFAALPSESLKGEEVDVMANGATVRAAVGDVGPWNGGHTSTGNGLNDPYWQNNSPPQAECGKDLRGRPTNGAGIDLSQALASKLRISGTTKVCWRGR